MEQIFVNNDDEKKELLNNKKYDFVIIGAGPSGTTAAIYASRSKLSTIVLDKAPGTGALALTHKIANYPAQENELPGDELLYKMRSQAKNFGALFVQTYVQGIVDGEEYKSIFTTDGIIQAKAIYIGIGAKGGRKNKIVGEDEFLGRGVSYCATCDAAFYKDKIVAVIGDNEEVVEEALVLQKFAQKVLIFVPGKNFSGKVNTNGLKSYSNIEIKYSTRIKEIVGTDTVEKIIDAEGEKYNLDGVFIYLAGNLPNTDFLNSIVAITEEGYIEVNNYMETNVPGIFAGGDIRKPPIKQVVIAAADGAIAAMSCEKYINKKNVLSPQYI